MNIIILLNSYFFVIIFAVTSTSLSQTLSNKKFVYNQPTIPTHFSSTMEEYLFYDNNFNVVRRLRDEKKAKENLLSDEDKKPVKVFLFEAPIEVLKSELVISRFIDNEDWKRVHRTESSILIPCLESDRVSFNTLKFKFGEPVYTTTGRKVLSRSTYYIEPVDSIGGFFAKFVPHIPGMDQKIEREILVNDYIKSQLEYLPNNMRNLTMDSFMGVNLSLLGIPISVAYRSAERILNQQLSSEKVFPGHGLLGCDECIKELANRRFPELSIEKAIDRWKIEEYLPKFAKYIAVSNHLLGLSFEAHTQNWTVKVNMETGKIIDFYFRDFADVLLNPTVLLSQNRMPKQIPWDRVKLFSLHRQYFSDLGAAIAKDIWFHSSLYVGQSVTSHINGFHRQQRHLYTFLSEYINQTEILTGFKINLTEDAQKIMNQLNSKVPKETFYSGEVQGRSPLRNAFASIVKPLFEQISAVALNETDKNLKELPLHVEQNELAKMFLKNLDLQRVIFLSESFQVQYENSDARKNWYKNTISAYTGISLSSINNSEIPLEFKVWNDRVWAIDKETKNPFAVMIDPLPKEKIKSTESPDKKSIFTFFKRKQKNAIQCHSLFN